VTASEPFLSWSSVPERWPAQVDPTAGGRTRSGRAARAANRGWFALGAALPAGPTHPGALGCGVDGDRREQYFRIVRRAAAR
jgi:hypothetical protein